MINYLEVTNGQFISSKKDSQQTVWIAVDKPTTDEIEVLTEKYKLPKDYITGVLDDNENSRLEGFYQQTLEKPVLLLLQYPVATISPSGYTQLNTFPFALILTADNKVITVVNQSADFLQQILAAPLQNNQAAVHEWFPLFLSLEISIRYNRFLKELIKQTNNLEGELKVSTENKQLYQLMDIQKSLVYFDSALHANLTVFNKLYQAQF